MCISAKNPKRHHGQRGSLRATQGPIVCGAHKGRRQAYRAVVVANVPALLAQEADIRALICRAAPEALRVGLKLARHGVASCLSEASFIDACASSVIMQSEKERKASHTRDRATERRECASLLHKRPRRGAQLRRRPISAEMPAGVCISNCACMCTCMSAGACARLHASVRVTMHRHCFETIWACRRRPGAQGIHLAIHGNV